MEIAAFLGSFGSVPIAGVLKLVDKQDLGSCAFVCEGSSPSARTFCRRIVLGNNAIRLLFIYMTYF